MYPLSHGRGEVVAAGHQKRFLKAAPAAKLRKRAESIERRPARARGLKQGLVTGCDPTERGPFRARASIYRDYIRKNRLLAARQDLPGGTGAYAPSTTRIDIPPPYLGGDFSDRQNESRPPEHMTEKNHLCIRPELGDDPSTSRSRVTCLSAGPSGILRIRNLRFSLRRAFGRH